MVIARRPSCSTICFVLAASSCSHRYRIAMSAPSRANSAATARPMPLSAPVISATLPFSRSGPWVPRLPIGLRLQLALVPGQPILVDHRLHDIGHGSPLLGCDAEAFAVEFFGGRLAGSGQRRSFCHRGRAAAWAWCGRFHASGETAPRGRVPIQPRRALRGTAVGRALRRRRAEPGAAARDQRREVEIVVASSAAAVAAEHWVAFS